MSDSTCENAPGSGSGGIQSSEELGMGRFSNDDVASASPKAPLFKPDQLNAFCGTGYELIKLHTPRDLDAKGNMIGKAPYKGWRVDAALAVDKAAEAMDAGHNVGVRLSVAVIFAQNGLPFPLRKPCIKLSMSLRQSGVVGT